MKTGATPHAESYSGRPVRSSSAAALALIAAVVGGAAVLLLGVAVGWLHTGETKTVVVRAPAATAGDAAAPIVAAKPLLGNGFQPAQIYRSRAPGVVTIRTTSWAFVTGIPSIATIASPPTLTPIPS